MITTTGQPRSGTSLVMQLLNALGFSIHGNKERKIITQKERVEHIKNMNPEGYWESPLVSLGVQEPIEEDAVKVMIGALNISNQELIDKVIICIRNPKNLANSHRTFFPKALVNNDKALLEGFRQLYMYLMRTDKDVLVIDYDNMVNNTKYELEQLCEFLDKPYSNKLLGVIKPELNRSKQAEWSRECLLEEANFYYNELKGYNREWITK